MTEPQRLIDLRERFGDVLESIRQRLGEENRRLFDEVPDEVEPPGVQGFVKCQHHATAS